MELRVLRYFLTVAEQENITRAAEILHVTQPTLSRQLAQTEEELGVRLFERGKRKITLTNEGILLCRRAKEILELVDKTEKELVEQETVVEGTVSIGCGDVKTVDLLAEMIRSFHRKYPAVRFELCTATADYVREQMEHGLLDIGLLLEPVNLEKYDYVRLKEEEQWVVVMHPDAPLAARQSVTAQQLREMPLVLPQRPNMQNELANWFGEDFSSLNVLATSNLPSVSCMLAHHRLAYGIIIAGSVSLMDEKKIVTRPLSPALKTSCLLVWKRQQPFGLAVAKFIEHVKSCTEFLKMPDLHDNT